MPASPCRRARDSAADASRVTVSPGSARGRRRPPRSAQAATAARSDVGPRPMSSTLGTKRPSGRDRLDVDKIELRSPACDATAFPGLEPPVCSRTIGSGPSDESRMPMCPGFGASRATAECPRRRTRSGPCRPRTVRPRRPASVERFRAHRRHSGAARPRRQRQDDRVEFMPFAAERCSDDSTTAPPAEGRAPESS